MGQYTEITDPLLQDLWKNKRITDFSNMRSHCQNSVYFALDVEGNERPGSSITGVGLAVARDVLKKSGQTETQADLARIVEDFAIEGHNFMCGNRRRNHGKYERSPFAKLHQVEKRDIDKALYNILDSASPAAPSITHWRAEDMAEDHENYGSNLVMIVWAGNSEFLAIASVIPSIIQKISYWVDIQDLVASMSSVPYVQQKPFSLRDTMLSLGFSREHTQKPSRAHSAGMDAVRTIGVLIELCSKKPSEKLLLVRHTMAERSRRMFWETRPRPHENFPFTVRISTAEHSMPPSLRHPHSLSKYIHTDCNTSEPIAVAVCPPSHHKRPKTHAWVCFADQCATDRFVEEWNGKEVDGQVLQITYQMY